MAHLLFRETLPVVVLEAGVARTIAALQSTHTSPLTVSLTQPAASSALTFTLSELSSRLLLLEQTITAESYVSLRDSQALRVDFSDFPRELSTLLRRPEQDRSFIAVLSLADVPAPAHTFEIVQLSNFRLLAHVELKPVPASPDAVLASLAARARDAEAAASSAETALASARTELQEISAALASARAEIATLREELPALRVAAGELESVRGEAAAAANEITTLRRELAVAQRERDAAEDARRISASELQNARAELEELRARAEALPAAIAAREREAARVAEMCEEVRKANAIVRTERERARVRNALIEKQHAKCEELRRSEAECKLERRRLEDLTRLREMEKEGLQGQVELLKAKKEEKEILLASNQETIAFLNKELNHLDILRDANISGRQRRTSTRTNSSAGSDAGATARATLDTQAEGHLPAAWTAGPSQRRATRAAASE